MRVLIAFGLLALASCAKPAPVSPGFDRMAKTDVAHGERLARVLGCTGCHGADLTGIDSSDELGTLWSANLTRAAERYSDAQLRSIIVGARRPDGSELWEMPSHLFTKLSEPEFSGLLAFIRSRPVKGAVHPRSTLGPRLREQVRQGSYRSSAAEVRLQGGLDVPPAGAEHAQARHIVRATCAECHKMELTGGQPSSGAEVRPDITEMIGGYSAAEFDTLLATGKASGNREVGLMSEVARGRFTYFTPHERRAIYDYLRALNAKIPG